MITPILITIAVLIVLFVLIVALQPAQFRITRSITVAATPMVVFAQVNDLHNWNDWSPWAKLDPAIKQTYQGPSAGTGAGYTWAGNKKVGEGRITITDSRPYEWVTLKLEFLKPFTATNIAQFTFEPHADHTQVTWAMSGQKNFMFKAAHLIMNMNKMLAREFDKGLSQMKTLVERKPNPTELQT